MVCFLFSALAGAGPPLLAVPDAVDRVGAAVPGAGQHGVPALVHVARDGVGVGALRRRLPRHLHRLARRLHDHAGGVGQLRRDRRCKGKYRNSEWRSDEMRFGCESNLMNCARFEGQLLEGPSLAGGKHWPYKHAKSHLV